MKKGGTVPKMLIVGVDAGSVDLFERWMSTGDMPGSMRLATERAGEPYTIYDAAGDMLVLRTVTDVAGRSLFDAYGLESRSRGDLHKSCETKL